MTENYRPIALTSCFSKIFEYDMLERLLQHLNNNDILSSCQHGFRAVKSTSTAILAFLEEIVEGLEAGKRPVGIFCDLSSAFDCVDHDMILGRLEQYGVTGRVLSGHSSFLRLRRQLVQVGNQTGKSTIQKA